MKRKDGFYWVQFYPGVWTVSQYDSAMSPFGKWRYGDNWYFADQFVRLGNTRIARKI
jgi:hypothetical protein